MLQNEIERILYNFILISPLQINSGNLKLSPEIRAVSIATVQIPKACCVNLS